MHPLCGRDADQLRRAAQQVRDCSQLVTVRDFHDLGRYAVEAHRCRQHLVCPMCAIFRGARVMAATLERVTAARRQLGLFRPYLLTLTLTCSDDLRSQLDLLMASWSKLWLNRKPIRRHPGNELVRLIGGVRSIEIKRGRNSGAWHAHMHSLVLADAPLPVEQDGAGAWRWPRLSDQWRKATGGSFIVECHPLTPTRSADADVPDLAGYVTSASPLSDFVAAVCEVSKYAVKLGTLAGDDLLTAWGCCSGRRLLDSFGCLRGIDRQAERESADAEKLMMDVHAFIEYSYRWKPATGYTVEHVRVDPGSIPY